MAKIVSLKNLIFYILNLQSSKTIVLATGCFDILHQAHFDFLKAAKRQGDLLIVGLESDQRVKILKGNNRPKNNWQKRAKGLAKSDLVDFIFSLPEKFNHEKEHLKLLLLIKPKILAVSQNTPFLELKRKLIKKAGARLFVFPFNFKYSTSKILTKKTT